MDERDEAKARAEAAEKAVTDLAKSLDLTRVYAYTKKEEVLDQLRDKEIEERHPKVDIDAALDELIIQSVEDDFNVDNFIEHYLKQVRNG